MYKLIHLYEQYDLMKQLDIIRDKLEFCGMKYFKRDFIDLVINKNAPNYSTGELSRRNIIIPIKKGKVYINNQIKTLSNPYIIGALYFEGEDYMFGGLQVYNKYGFTTQISEIYTIYNTKYSFDKIIDGFRFKLIKQRDSFFYGIKKINIEGISINFMSPERAIIKMIKDNPLKDIDKEVVSKIDISKLIKMSKSKINNNIFNKIIQLQNDGGIY